MCFPSVPSPKDTEYACSMFSSYFLQIRTKQGFNYAGGNHALGQRFYAKFYASMINLTNLSDLNLNAWSKIPKVKEKTISTYLIYAIVLYVYFSVIH